MELEIKKSKPLVRVEVREKTPEFQAPLRRRKRAIYKNRFGNLINPPDEGETLCQGGENFQGMKKWAIWKGKDRKNKKEAPRLSRQKIFEGKRK